MVWLRSALLALLVVSEAVDPIAPHVLVVVPPGQDAVVRLTGHDLDGDKLKAESALRPGYVPGQIGFEPLGLAPEDPAEFRVMQEKELAHARLAMIAAAGFLSQEAVSKATWGTVYGLPDL